MREIITDLQRWQAQDKKIAIVRVVDLEGSGPRLPGASMAVSEDS
ncbi:MAG: XdhC family protein, partial [Actinobacteria bacterium]|nr:XdhC family protein [Actinomycetota bacterium]